MEISSTNTVGKPHISFQNIVSPPHNPQLNGPISANPNARPWYFNQSQGHQWLIPVMSPSEGLVYKPYPSPTFATPTPLTSTFLAPSYGIPAPPPPFSPAEPHSYFPTYGKRIMNSAAISSSSVEQPNPSPPTHDRGSPDALNSLYVSKDSEVQASTASSRAESRGKGGDTERTNLLPLFPVAPVLDPSRPDRPTRPRPDRPSQVIKVVPHNARTATESAARIFQSIQKERKL